ncbi:MAG: hypothetical protein IJS79_05125 [Oscillospiraceae bacterium]|nr:hypothetical protein [Oscillospiraceae bacterium]
MQIKGTKLIYGNLTIASLLSWLPALFYISNIYRMMGYSAYPYAITLVACGTVGLVALWLGKIARRGVLFTVLFVFFITGVLNYLFIKNLDLNEILLDFLYVGMMITMIVFPMSYAQAFISFYVSIAFFLYGYVTGADTHYLLISSGNYISILIILAESLYYLTIQMTEHDFSLIDLIPALLCFILSVWAKGRGGILCCLIMLAGVSLYYALACLRKNINLIYFISLAALVIIGYLLLSKVDLSKKFMSLGKWSNSGLDNSYRERMWRAYFYKTRENALFLYLGTPLEQVPIIHVLNDNTHNSFLQLHATNGIVPFVLFALLFVKSLIWEIKHKKELIAIVLFSIFIRGMTDKFIFGQYGMPVLLFLILYPYFDEYISKRTAEMSAVN